jgi:DNA-binding transcriptional LysR family regulator
VRIHPVARRDHPLATCGTPIPPALLRAHPQIVLRDSAHDPASPSLNVLEGRLRWTVTDVTAKRDVILAGMGWGGLPDHVVADALASRAVVRLQVPEFEIDVMELFAMAASRPRARRGHAGVVGGAQAATVRRPRSHAGDAPGWERVSKEWDGVDPERLALAISRAACLRFRNTSRWRRPLRFVA